MGFDTPNQGDNVLESGDVDHQQTTNRTHNGDSLTPASVSAEQTEATNETLIEADRTTDTNSITSGTYSNIFDSEVRDRRSEFDSSAEFVPDKGGLYHIYAAIYVQGNTSQGDNINIRVRNTTDGDILNFDERTATDSLFTPSTSMLLDLTAGKAHALEIANLSSSYKITTGGTFGFFVRSVVQ